jgi:hypothetical protein
MKSGLPGNGWCLRQPVTPYSRKIASMRASVPLFPLLSIRAITMERLEEVKMSAILGYLALFCR